jgi:hypothetical protein
MIYWYSGILLALVALSQVDDVMAIASLLIGPSITLVAVNTLLLYSLPPVLSAPARDGAEAKALLPARRGRQALTVPKTCPRS